MSKVSRDRDRQHLEWELQGSHYRESLQLLQGEELLLQQFETWSDFIAFMREGVSDDPHKQKALLAILKAHAQDQDPRWRAILLATFWPGLESIFNHKADWDADQQQRWQNVQWAFLQTICRLNISRRSDHLVKRIIQGSVHRLHEEYRRDRKHMDSQLPTEPEQFEQMIGGEEIDFEAMDLRLWQETEIKRLRVYVEAGCISEADFLLLVGTRVYGKSAAQYAREIGISSGLARKRRQRAEAAIRSFQESY